MKKLLVDFSAVILFLVFCSGIAKCQDLRVRKSVTSLSETEVASLRRGISAMKSRSASDPTSWQFQANIHGTMNGDHELFNQCVHFNGIPDSGLHFLSWHRAYLHFFERILRAAADDPDLTLPYWNWSEDRALPEIFRDPAVPSNPLFMAGRNMNGGQLLPLSVVQSSLTDAMNRLQFHSSDRFNPGFSNLIEGSPHGVIHSLVGGAMGRVPTAANDPVFWFHHCNVDRNWDLWLRRGDGRKSPTDPAFLNQRYTLVDENKDNVTFRIRDLIDSQQLGYRYDDIPIDPRESLLVMANNETFSRIASTRRSGLESATQRTELGFKTSRKSLTVAPGGFESMTSKDKRTVIVVQDIQLKTAPNFSYGVYINLPVDAEGDREREEFHRAGIINFFGMAADEHNNDHEKAKFSPHFDITDLVRRLAGSGRLAQQQSFEVVLKPITLVTDEQGFESLQNSATQSATAADITYDSIEILQK